VVRAGLTGDLLTTRFGHGDELDFTAPADVNNVQRRGVEMRQLQTDGQHELFGMHGNRTQAAGGALHPIPDLRRLFRPTPEEVVQTGQRVDAQRAKRVAHINLQPAGLVRYREKGVAFRRGGANKKPDITNSLGCCESGFLDQTIGGCRRRGRVGHVQHSGYAPGQGGCRAGVKIFFVGIAWFPQVHMHIDESRQSDPAHDPSVVGDGQTDAVYGLGR
jgi:hypothetical protein